MVDFSSSDDYSSGHDNYSHGHHSLEGHLQGLDLTSGQYSSIGEYSTSSTEYRDFGYYHYGADIAQHPPPYYSDVRPLANHLNLLDLTDKHTIILIETIHIVSILIAGIMIMMSLYLIGIQCGNDYISRYLLMYFVQFTILCMYFDIFLPTMRVFMLSLYVEYAR